MATTGIDWEEFFPFCETAELLRGLENVSEASIYKSGERVLGQQLLFSNNTTRPLFQPFWPIQILSFDFG